MDWIKLILDILRDAYAKTDQSSPAKFAYLPGLLGRLMNRAAVELPWADVQNGSSRLAYFMYSYQFQDNEKSNELLVNHLDLNMLGQMEWTEHVYWWNLWRADSLHHSSAPSETGMTLSDTYLYGLEKLCTTVHRLYAGKQTVGCEADLHNNAQLLIANTQAPTRSAYIMIKRSRLVVIHVAYEMNTDTLPSGGAGSHHIQQKWRREHETLWFWRYECIFSYVDVNMLRYFKVFYLFQFLFDHY